MCSTPYRLAQLPALATMWAWARCFWGPDAQAMQAVPYLTGSLLPAAPAALHTWSICHGCRRHVGLGDCVVHARCGWRAAELLGAIPPCAPPKGVLSTLWLWPIDCISISLYGSSTCPSWCSLACQPACLLTRSCRFPWFMVRFKTRDSADLQHSLRGIQNTVYRRKALLRRS